MAARRSSPIVLLLLLILGAGLFLTIWWFRQPKPPDETATLSVVDFADLPGWTTTDPRNALVAFGKSCPVLAQKGPSLAMGGGGYAGTAGDWQRACKAIRMQDTAAAARHVLEGLFAPVEIKADDGSQALFTGYYEPELFARRKQHGAYRIPIYGRPSDLVSVDLGAFRDNLKGEHLDGCLQRHRLLPCATRAEIDKRGLADAPILFYASDPISVFFLHIQGSGRVRLTDDSIVRVVYAGQNGRPYTSVARTLIDRGLLPRGGMSMQAIRAWMKANPLEAQQVMETDQSYVFFREKPLGDPSLGSPGSEGIALTPVASIAVDARFHPLGIPFYIAANRPDPESRSPDHAFNQLMIAQDTGGAIRGPDRADIFWGFGSLAESIAGRMKSYGRFFVFLPKPVARKLGQKTSLQPQ